MDRNYMFTVTQRVDNNGATPLILSAYGRIQRLGTPQLGISSILHEGPIGVFGGVPGSEKYTLHETKYSKIRKEHLEQYDSVGGWLGITDKYWLVAAVPDPKAELHASYFWELQNQTDVYQVAYRGVAQTIAPGATGEARGSLFAGAKEVLLLDSYRDNFAGVGIPLFDRAVDFSGYLGYFLTLIAKPLFYLLHAIYRLVGNFGIAIMVLTVLVKAVFFPLANKSYRAMNKMKKLGPQMAELRAQFQDDKARLNQEMMALYKREKVNPAAGCLPILVQIPVFIALYQVLYVTIEMRQAPFFGWIKDLSVPDPTSIFNLFGLLPWGVPDLGPLHILSIGVWPLVMGLTMFLQQRMNPPPPDPVQAKLMMALPIVFTFMLAQFAAGLVIYWAWNNTLSITQQWLLKRIDAASAAKP
jgi:YidC/Oxa1 family membrane protein insertase